ncbi:MAG: lysozyme inhibitor LprI family protein [Candidatus Sulfotelmatobacter sp.]
MASRTMTHMPSKPAPQLLCLILLFLGEALYAQHMNAPDAPCQAPASNAEKTACFIQESKTADGRLNKIYARIREVLSPDEQNDLQAAQRLWLRFRDANCSAERNLYSSGSATPTVYAACIEAETRKRTNDLKEMYGWRLEKLGKPIE